MSYAPGWLRLKFSAQRLDLALLFEGQAAKTSHFGSYCHPFPEGIGDEQTSMGG
jgi:hypothetical protein